jgi:3-dehydroquinate synthase
MTTTDTSMTSIRVGGPAPYDVLVGPGAATRVPEVMSDVTSVAVVHDERLGDLAAPVAAAVRAAGARVQVVSVPSGEQAKTLDVVARLWDDFASAGLTRSDAVVAVGGGATTDVVGFAAATWLRGVRVVHVPTTLLAMVDAAVGGKTGINTAAGKNLAGAFHPPAAVLVDLDLLAGLPQHEWVNGMAEVVKAGFIADPVILDLIEADIAGAAQPAGPSTRAFVERSIAMKAHVVSADLKEAGPREMLNYGHTLGHAIERHANYTIPHGHAVSVGMVFAAELAGAAGRLDDATVSRHRQMLGGLGLPTSYSGDAWPALLDTMRVDKKARRGTLRFVVLDGVGRPAILAAPDEDLLAAAYREVSS